MKVYAQVCLAAGLTSVSLALKLVHGEDVLPGKRDVTLTYAPPQTTNSVVLIFAILIQIDSRNHPISCVSCFADPFLSLLNSLDWLKDANCVDVLRQITDGQKNTDMRLRLGNIINADTTSFST